MGCIALELTDVGSMIRSAYRVRMGAYYSVKYLLLHNFFQLVDHHHKA
jgi:hypothetical protein